MASRSEEGKPPGTQPADGAAEKSAPKPPSADTPAMRQYRRFKEQHPECVLFFRMGDFYEMFHEDARLAHKVLGVTLTQRTEGVPMAGVPYHAVEGYLRRMIQAGYRVAVCEQVEDPAQAKGVVKRNVTRVVTPGTLTDEALLEEGASNPLAAVMFHDDEHTSAAWLEVSTGAFELSSFKLPELIEELSRLSPRELLFVQTANPQPPPRVARLLETLGCVGTPLPPWQFRLDEAVEVLCRQYGVAQLAGFGLSHGDPALGPAGAIVHYLLETQRGGDGGMVERLAHLQPPRRFDRAAHLVIDPVSLRSLEVEKTLRSGTMDGSLLGVFATGPSHPVTAIGRRLLRRWLCYPLASRNPIEARQRIVRLLVDDAALRDGLRGVLEGVQDVERIGGRIAVGRATPRDLAALGRSASQVEGLGELLRDQPALADHHARLESVREALADLAGRIGEACIDQPPVHLREGGLVRDGYDAQLDELRSLQRDSHTWLAGYQKQLIEQTGAPSLKVGYNKVFGYYIELTSTHRDKAPDHWSRKQTLKNAERFITPELKDYETKVLNAEQQAIAREQAIFNELCKAVGARLNELSALAAVVGELDVLGCFAVRAVRGRYAQPRVVEQPVLHVDAGRHPVLDQMLGDRFVANDVALGPADAAGEDGPAAGESEGDGGEEGGEVDAAATATAGDEATMAIITGPNMAGKSTYIRQAALIALLAHTGSFVPARRAVVGLCDRIFTRVGASDELHAGQSTFMVEMTETANICHHATEKSLVILDEIGRGTSTLDGLALAWAIAEYLADRRCRTLFATHYHEITDLARTHPHVRNLNVTVREWQDQIVFLHRIVPGSTNRSYGIHVARIAGVPTTVIRRANELLGQLEVSHQAPAIGGDGDEAQTGAAGGGDVARGQGRTGAGRGRRGADGGGQLPLFTEVLQHPVVSQLQQLQIDKMSPLEAFDTLRQLAEQAGSPDGTGR